MTARRHYILVTTDKHPDPKTLMEAFFNDTATFLEDTVPFKKEDIRQPSTITLADGNSNRISFTLDP